ncbi:phage tail sheath subtilisin-like domain-containing protein [Lacinutrix sp. C3R15]|uniref:phage tail sheath family protein n=1 Tax=Flavobacteriaceae TaxID=49546 RepID=UPI001C088CF0|nr:MULTISPECIES: phage tail sheath C-terminal domain-containing protein [Flavobacteriaceae]MBU2939241.1 phage tail sheath subtilisin-like domain-containing protein [Lacinutrix sp. C3R15]MDO6622556.1 phage tail sheath C-terminal domain-containing protein [Oceanihabitans sp. 1_MG-2023]
MTAKYKIPGVYVEEVKAFHNSILPVPTAIPAFVGYTPQASFEGKSYYNVPKKITSFADFKAIFCYPDAPEPATPIKQYNPEYYLVKQKHKPNKGSYITIAGEFYAIVPDPNTIYYMYNSIQLFYENGGGDAYIVSVGTYGSPSKKPMHPEEKIVNANVKLDDLQNGIALLKKEQEPTMYICPEATLLSVANNGTLMQSMLFQNSEMQTAISVFDIIGGDKPDPILFTEDIEVFRNNTGAKGLSFGCAYYPFIATATMLQQDIDFTNLFGGDITCLEALLNSPSAPNEIAAEILKTIQNINESDLTIAQLNTALLAASNTYAAIIKKVLAAVNMLPPSGAIAGVITTTDNQVGVWKAPANTSIVGAVSLPINLTSANQEYLNVDAVSGKSINAIRLFNGLGILIWGARTLDGNSNEWRYIPVRRTLIFLEQSCTLATKAFVFEPNNSSTWLVVKEMISNFLYSIWRQGGLQGAKPEDAFFVRCGLNETMTNHDILNHIMIVNVGVSVVRPAEFIIFSFQQKMAQSS